MKVEERLVPDAERLSGLVDLAHLYFLGAREDDFLLYTQQPPAEVALTHRLALVKKNFFLLITFFFIKRQLMFI